MLLLLTVACHDTDDDDDWNARKETQLNVNRNDTIQETMSLSSRFGLTILFNKPSKPDYLAIVKSLAKAKGIEMDEDELEKQASAFAIRKGGATPRAAEQFTNSLLAK